MKVDIGDFPYNNSERPVSIKLSSHDLWNLDSTLSHVILACLKAFKESHCGYPPSITSDEYNVVLDKMILCFDLIIRDGRCERVGRKAIDEGLQLFAQYFRSLWD
jgi:hypothetical protein